MLSKNHNPDVLTCLANLSSDEVFTPPALANQMLDLLPAGIWRNKNARFLDPFCKSGIFLREITKRLQVGLKAEIPDEKRRLNHILKNQVFGIAITELTALMSRRSLYCSKTADGKYSICDGFDSPSGNVIFNNIRHTWENDRCVYCGTSRSTGERDDSLEAHAYQFLHTNNPDKIFDMKFDVIIGNPPYQLSDGGHDKSATPIYNRFVEQAIKLNPKYLCMIIPARWYAGGKGLDEFRAKMLADQRIAEIHDFPDTSDCFPGVNIRGGVCYFLWDRDRSGECKITTHKAGVSRGPVERPLLEPGSDSFIRYNEAIPILRKVQKHKEASFSTLVSAHKAFGLRTFVRGKDEPFASSVKLYQTGGIGYIKRSEVEKNEQWIDRWKVVVPYASPGDDSYPHLILSKPIISEPGSCSTETYLVVGPFKNKSECANVSAYMKTRFLRFLVLLLKPSQHVTQKTYGFVPMQDFSEEWTDEKLFKKYGITNAEIAFIDTLIKPIDA